MRKLILILATLALLLTTMATPVSAHGCHPSSRSGTSPIAYQRRTENDGYFTYIDATSDIHSTLHVATGEKATHFVQLENGVGYARIMREASSDGLMDYVTFTLRDQNGTIKTLAGTNPNGMAVSATAALRFEIVFDFSPANRFRFYVNGVQRAWWSGAPFWTPQTAKLGGNTSSGATQFLGWQTYAFNARFSGVDYDTSTGGITPWYTDDGSTTGPIWYQSHWWTVMTGAVNEINLYDADC